MTANRETIVVVGAGVCGLTLARELLRAGRRVIVVEGRDRLGGRICPLSTDEFGYSAEGGAEFIHGVAAHTHRLIQEAGLSAIPIHGSTWNFEDDVLSEDMERIPYHDRLEAKLKSLQCDQPVSTFLDENFPEPKFAALRQSVIQLVQGYDAADPHRASAFTLREELSQFNDGPAQMRIKEGYGALVRYLERECHAAGAEIRLHHRVRSIHHGKRCWVECANGERLDFRRLILTVPLSLIPELEFVPALPEKVAAAKRIGFGGVIKAVIRFRDNWWAGARGKDLSNMTFLFSREEFPTWWTQFPSPVPVLTGWLAGPQAEKFRDVPPAEILELAFRSLAHIFGVELQFLREECVAAEAPNWCSDAFTRGAYTYAAVGDSEAREELRRPVADRIFFAGEALADGADASTVEGAIASGLRVSQQILSI